MFVSQPRVENALSVWWDGQDFYSKRSGAQILRTGLTVRSRPRISRGPLAVWATPQDQAGNARLRSGPAPDWILRVCKVAQSCPTLSDPVDCSPPGSSVHGDSPGKNTGVGCQALLQGSFPTQNWTRVSCLLHWQAGSSPPAALGKHFPKLPRHPWLPWRLSW